MLKDWLVRRRENPYPNREEKKLLACETGLTYTQICNWFANWRRKLKNSGNDPIKKTWGNLIKNYNTSAKGNVEQFSICSNDSIWGENGDDSQGSRSPQQCFPKRQYVGYTNNMTSNGNNNNNNNNCNGFTNYMKFVERRGSDTSDDENGPHRSRDMYYDHCYTPKSYNAVFGLPTQTRCDQMNSSAVGFTPDFNTNTTSILTASFPHAYRADNGTYYLTPSTTVSPAHNMKSTNKYKNCIMEKYLRDLNEIEPDDIPSVGGQPDSSNPFQQLAGQSQPTSQPANGEVRGPPSLSKWLESTAKFTPSKNNYIDWNQPGKSSTSKKRCDFSYFNQPAPASLQQNPSVSQLPSDMIGQDIHQRDEIDAAEALTRLANNFRLKFYT
ncbi:serine/threonine-protein kinase atg1 isoform X2 [Malaya genurostris]|nr:serine/threonine-protein kinase atg1 isoform X2 [Malaya genurostris]